MHQPPPGPTLFFQALTRPTNVYWSIASWQYCLALTKAVSKSFRSRRPSQDCEEKRQANKHYRNSARKHRLWTCFHTGPRQREVGSAVARLDDIWQLQHPAAGGGVTYQIAQQDENVDIAMRQAPAR
jgi:hypothetical protein